MTIEEAYKKMYELMKKEMDHYYKNIQPIIDSAPYHIDKNGNHIGSSIEIPEEIKKEKEILENNVKSFEKELAAYPHICPILEYWMVDIYGDYGEAGEKEMEKVLNDLDFKSYIEAQGSIPSTIQKFIENQGFKITDRGGGVGGWNIGVPCNDGESNRLCCLLHDKFKNLIDKKYIKILKVFWGYRLPGLRNWNDVSEYENK